MKKVLEGTDKQLKALLDQFAQEVNQNNHDKGFWECANIGEKISLIHAELSEALEAARYGDPISEHIPEFSGVEEELADVVLRTLDLCAENGYDLVGAMLAKHDCNKTRPRKHDKLF